MPPLKGFSDNAFVTHEDFKKACTSLLYKLQPYQSAGGARIRLPFATGTHFDDIAAQLEGYARPLWAVGALLQDGCLTEKESRDLVEPYVRGLANGTDPKHEEYWGIGLERDQRSVEMEIISFALMSAPDVLFDGQPLEAKKNIIAWLNTINDKDFPTTNWLWFRVMTNLALVKVCGVPYQELKKSMETDLDYLEKFYLADGWAADGFWNDDGRQADYYSGSFAIQFSQLLYVKMAEDLDPGRCGRFRLRAAEFATSFWRYFDFNGAAIPFGRSLTYRFAVAGFWSAAVYAGVDLPSPCHDVGVVKGILLRHMRYWSTKHDMFNIDGTLTIGFAYPNMYMSEDYNSAQSSYWTMKTFLALGLPSTNPFWTTEEKPLPQETPRRLATIVKPPMQILCNTGNHHFLLSAGQFCPWPLKATEAKYGKFAYSSAFGFSVPTGPLIPQMAPDSTLALSRDSGDTWRVPWKVQRFDFSTVEFVSEKADVIESIPAIRSSWKPWRDTDLTVHTLLIAPCAEWPDWYVRAHKITNTSLADVRHVSIVQGGWAIQNRTEHRGEILPSFSEEAGLFTLQDGYFPEGMLQSANGAIVCSSAGVSGIKSVQYQSNQLFHIPLEVTPELLKPDANTNLISQRTSIPTLVSSSKALLGGKTCVAFAAGVFGLRRDGLGGERYHVEERWKNGPLIVEKGTTPSASDVYIRVEKHWEE
ncbi:hypothetical protein P154DRAFT_479812 [Amniculicola lignicola CBS 123094]|uniref:Uncharacterized protein n=1 Tax=Amniculicola lignicola CBS 123094 TaxID=1392246 RepID=A0A6A5WZ97_9PLEO|nr:hypothetical protein P154DRAFT_479812 [Amniculicola lignicola CBS 123094]